MSLRSCQNTIGVVIILSFFKCTNHSASPASEVSTHAGNKTHPTAGGKSLADTVTLHFSNGSLSPDYQFSRELVLTEKEAMFRETVGEESEVVIRKKMDPQFWESVRRFDKSMTYDPPERLEGADEAYLIFYVSGKAYRFPFLAMEGRAASIQDFFEPN